MRQGEDEDFADGAADNPDGAHRRVACKLSDYIKNHSRIKIMVGDTRARALVEIPPLRRLNGAIVIVDSRQRKE